MKCAACLFFVCIASLGADGKPVSPVSPNVIEGKSVYKPLNSPVNLAEEARIQKNDQNSSRNGFQK